MYLGMREVQRTTCRSHFFFYAGLRIELRSSGQAASTLINVPSFTMVLRIGSKHIYHLSGPLRF